MNPSQHIDKQIEDHPDWRGVISAHLRKIINDTEPHLEEAWKWDTAVWTHNGLICAVGIFKDHVKINFFKGAKLKDPQKMFNAGLDAKISRSIDLHEGDTIDKVALQELVREAIAFNMVKGK